MLNIRNEEPRDYKIVESITRNAFYNLYINVNNLTKATTIYSV